jgi:hypothetical protein
MEGTRPLRPRGGVSSPIPTDSRRHRKREPIRIDPTGVCAGCSYCDRVGMLCAELPEVVQRRGSDLGGYRCLHVRISASRAIAPDHWSSAELMSACPDADDKDGVW